MQSGSLHKDTVISELSGPSDMCMFWFGPSFHFGLCCLIAWGKWCFLHLTASEYNGKSTPNARSIPLHRSEPHRSAASEMYHRRPCKFHSPQEIYSAPYPMLPTLGTTIESEGVVIFYAGHPVCSRPRRYQQLWPRVTPRIFGGTRHRCMIEQQAVELREFSLPCVVLSVFTCRPKTNIHFIGRHLLDVP